MTSKILYLFLVFMFYSIIGYICELVYCSLNEHKFVNRGFFCGPYCPIYGVGAVFILFILTKYREDPVLVFLLGAIITSALEYFTSFILEKIFHNKWWDYEGKFGNINGRICVQNSILFGLGTMALIYIADPTINKLICNFSILCINIISICLMIIFVIDCVYSIIVAYNLRNRIIICEELKNQKIAKIPGMLEKLIKERVDNFKTYPKRLLEAFPNLKKSNYKEFELMKKLRNKNKKKKKSNKKGKK